MRDTVRWFAEQMEAKLAANDRERGDDGWLGAHGLHHRYFLSRLLDEVLELQAAIVSGKPINMVIGEAADVANFAMMIADRERQR